MGEHDNDFDLAMAVGELRGLLEGVNQRLDKINGTVAANAKTLQKHEIIIGKIGLVVTAVGVAFSFIGTIAMNWINKKFHL